MQSPNLKSILNCSIHERSPSLQVLWQHYQSEVNPEGAYSNDPYRREAIVLHALWQLGQFEINPEGASFTEPFRRNAFSCMFCGNMISTKSKFKEHTQMLHTGENNFFCKSCGHITRPNYNLKEHTPMIHTGEKPFSASSVAAWQL